MRDTLGIVFTVDRYNYWKNDFLLLSWSDCINCLVCPLLWKLDFDSGSIRWERYPSEITLTALSPSLHLKSRAQKCYWASVQRALPRVSQVSLVSLSLPLACFETVSKLRVVFVSVSPRLSYTLSVQFQLTTIWASFLPSYVVYNVFFFLIYFI